MFEWFFMIKKVIFSFVLPSYWRRREIVGAYFDYMDSGDQDLYIVSKYSIIGPLW